MPTCATGTSPSNGQPNEVAIAPSTGIPASFAIRTTSSKPSSDSSTERLTFLRLWLSDAETNTRISSTPASAARSAPLAFGTSAANLVPLERSTPCEHLGRVGELRHGARRDEGRVLDDRHARRPPAR